MDNVITRPPPENSRRGHGTGRWRLAYRLGLTPWERVGAVGAARLDRLVAGETTGMPPYGRLLDIGCGSGAHAVRLAAQGWEVTGVDVVPQAIERARVRAAAGNVAVAWVTGDAADLLRLARPGFRVVLDVGCFHSLDERRRDGYARAVANLAAPGAALIMMAFTPKTGPRPGPRGAAVADLLDRLPGWRLESETPEDAPVPRVLGDVRPRWLTLRNGAVDRSADR